MEGLLTQEESVLKVAVKTMKSEQTAEVVTMSPFIFGDTGCFTEGQTLLPGVGGSQLLGPIISFFIERRDKDCACMEYWHIQSSLQWCIVPWSCQLHKTSKLFEKQDFCKFQVVPYQHGNKTNDATTSKFKQHLLNFVHLQMIHVFFLCALSHRQLPSALAQRWRIFSERRPA